MSSPAQRVEAVYSRRVGREAVYNVKKDIQTEQDSPRIYTKMEDKEIDTNAYSGIDFACCCIILSNLLK